MVVLIIRECNLVNCSRNCDGNCEIVDAQAWRADGQCHPECAAGQGLGPGHRAAPAPGGDPGADAGVVAANAGGFDHRGQETETEKKQR